MVYEVPVVEDNGLPLVLILVLMEYGLRDINKSLRTVENCVLILVLMEYGLRVSLRNMRL